MIRYIAVSLVLIFSLNPLGAEECCYDYPSPDQYYDEDECHKDLKNRHLHGSILTVSPEYYHLERKRKGGTKQHGELIGFRAKYDYIKKHSLYAGVEYVYGTGHIHGKSGNDSKIRSRWTDEQIEGRFGYTFQGRHFPFLSFTPYGGAGYLKERNKFESPSPLLITFHTRSQFFNYGFISSAMINDNWTLGLNVEVRRLWQPKCKITGDEKYGRINQLIEDENHYRAELPIVYNQRFLGQLFEFGICPFYELRNYGGRENFPFDFFKTEINIYGLDFQFILQF